MSRDLEARIELERKRREGFRRRGPRKTKRRPACFLCTATNVPLMGIPLKAGGEMYVCSPCIKANAEKEAEIRGAIANAENAIEKAMANAEKEAEIRAAIAELRREGET